MKTDLVLFFLDFFLLLRSPLHAAISPMIVLKRMSYTLPLVTSIPVLCPL